MDKITCIIIDDEREARERMEQLLTNFDFIEILAKEGDTDIATDKIYSLKPDIVFLDIEMPGKSGLELVNEIKNKCIYPTFIFVTGYHQYAIKAIKQSAFDYLVKPIDIDELKETLERYKQNSFKNRDDKLLDIPLFSCLSEREKEILKLIIKGHTSKEIANILFISKTTVDSHRKNILEKTDTKKISDLIIKILSNN